MWLINDVLSYFLYAVYNHWRNHSLRHYRNRNKDSPFHTKGMDTWIYSFFPRIHTHMLNKWFSKSKCICYYLENDLLNTFIKLCKYEIAPKNCRYIIKNIHTYTYISCKIPFETRTAVFPIYSTQKTTNKHVLIIALKHLWNISWKWNQVHLPITDIHRYLYRQLEQYKKSNKQSHHFFNSNWITVKVQR